MKVITMFICKYKVLAVCLLLTITTTTKSHAMRACARVAAPRACLSGPLSRPVFFPLSSMPASPVIFARLARKASPTSPHHSRSMYQSASSSYSSGRRKKNGACVAMICAGLTALALDEKTAYVVGDEERLEEAMAELEARVPLLKQIRITDLKEQSDRICSLIKAGAYEKLTHGNVETIVGILKKTIRDSKKFKKTKNSKKIYQAVANAIRIIPSSVHIHIITELIIFSSDGDMILDALECQRITLPTCAINFNPSVQRITVLLTKDLSKLDQEISIDEDDKDHVVLKKRLKRFHGFLHEMTYRR